MKLGLAILGLLAGTAACSGASSIPCSSSKTYPEPGACPDPNIPKGDPGGKCPDWPGSCEAGTKCYRNTCIPCGDPGELCCAITNNCNGGTCKSQPGDNPNLCDSTCGQSGQPCCQNGYGCGDGLICHDASMTCVAVLDPECNGSTQYYVPTREKSNKCAGPPAIVLADNATQATACAEKVLKESNTHNVLELLTPHVGPKHPTDYEVCVDTGFPPNSQLYVKAHSEADALTCAENGCVNCTATIGSCP